MISLCMIVKNEEKNLFNCLSSIFKLVDDIVIIDTGSCDRTKAIAGKFTTKVYDYEWENDFAAARNYSISHAEHDWVLILDADEFTVNYSKEDIHEFVSNTKNEKIVGRISRTNIIEDEKGIRRKTEKISRLFNRNRYHYEGIIHEQIVSNCSSSYNTVSIPVYLEHIGYTKEKIKETNKIDRNKVLILKALKDNTYDPYLHYQIGKTYFMEKSYENAYRCFEEALSFDIDYRLEYVYDLIECYGYALINSGNYAKAKEIEKYKAFYNNIADFNFLLGLVNMNNAKFDDAVNLFIRCTQLNTSQTEGISSYMPLYNIGVIYEILGYKDQAVEYYSLCGNYAPAQRQLKLLNK